MGSEPTLTDLLMERRADLSFDRRYRYSLWRCWGPGNGTATPALTVIGLNPSTADEEVDDPTVRRLIGFAQRNGFLQLTLVNLFAYRATSPADMRKQGDPVGPENDIAIQAAVAHGDVTLIAWGTHGAYRDRHYEVLRLLRDLAGEFAFPLKCLGLTKDGYPRHPLYLRNDTPMTDWPSLASFLSPTAAKLDSPQEKP